MAKEEALDPEIVALAGNNLDELDQRREQAQARAAVDFHQFYTGLPMQEPAQ